MCGIFGWFVDEAKVSEKQRAILAAALEIENDSRGGDSWGYAAILKGEKHLMKHGLGYMSLGCKAERLAQYGVVLAHTRKASTGAVTVRNAHPYEIGHIVGAHNGMIDGNEYLNKKFHRSHEVDSMHLIHHISEKRNLKELSGWGAVEYFDLHDMKSIYVGTFSGDLTVYGLGTPKHTVGVVWSSAAKAMERAVALAGIPAYAYKIKERRLYQITAEGVYTTDKALDISRERIPYTLDNDPTEVKQGLLNTLQKNFAFGKEANAAGWMDKCEICSSDYPRRELAEHDGLLVCEGCVNQLSGK